MSKAISAAKYVQPGRHSNGRLIAKGTLRRGIRIGEEFYRDFELHEAITADLLAAERDADLAKPLNFHAALLVRQLQRVGSYDGPITLGMISALHSRDFAMLREAQAELDLLGEAIE